MVKVFHGSPAEEGGIEAGDTIVSVEGESIAGLNSTEATDEIKGPEGSQVTVGVLDAKTKKTSEKTLTRAEVELPERLGPHLHHRRKKIGYVRLFSFSAEASKQLAHGIEKVNGKGPKGSSSTCARTRAGCSKRRSTPPRCSCPPAKPW